MSKNSSKDRASLCAFTFSDGRRCQTPRLRKQPYCFFHARKFRLVSQAEEVGEQLSSGFANDYISAMSLNASLGRLFSAVAQDQMKPKTARTLAYIAQLMVQTSFRQIRTA